MSGRYILRVLAAAALPLCLLSCKDEGGERALLPIAQKALTDTASVYYTDLSSYPEDISKLPIGVLDCSVNGFEVVERLLTLDRFDNITGKPSPDGMRISSFCRTGPTDPMADILRKAIWTFLRSRFCAIPFF